MDWRIALGIAIILFFIDIVYAKYFAHLLKEKGKEKGDDLYQNARYAAIIVALVTFLILWAI